MVQYIRLAIIITTLMTIFLGLYRRSSLPFDKLISIAATVLLIHSGNAMFSGLYMGDKLYVDTAAPYGLLYGPLLWFGLKIGTGGEVSKKKVILHSSPFLLSFFFYLCILFFPSIREEYLKSFLRILYILLPVSFSVYALWAFLGNVGKVSGYSKDGQRLLNFSTIILIVTASFFFTVRFTKDPEQPAYEYPVLIIYGIMFMASAMLLFYKFSTLNNRLQKPKLEVAELDTTKEKISNVSERYKKSAVSEDILQEYERKLKILLEKEKIYLDPEVNLRTTASSMKIPTHHLSQTVNRRFGKNFNQLINSYRIDHACELISTNKGTLSLEEVAFASGFNSRFSFSRNFKMFKNCSPSEFKKNQAE